MSHHTAHTATTTHWPPCTTCQQGNKCHPQSPFPHTGHTSLSHMRILVLAEASGSALRWSSWATPWLRVRLPSFWLVQEAPLLLWGLEMASGPASAQGSA